MHLVDAKKIDTMVCSPNINTSCYDENNPYYKIINRKYNDLLVKQQQNPDILIKVLERFSSPEKNQEIRIPEDSPRK